MSTVYRRVLLRWDVECYVINLDDTVLGQVLCLLMHASQLADVATVSVVDELQQSVSIKCLHGGNNGMHQGYRIVLLDSIHTNVLEHADMCFRIVVGDVSTQCRQLSEHTRTAPVRTSLPPAVYILLSSYSRRT